METLSLITPFEMGKADRETFVSRVVEMVREGQADPLKVQSYVKNMESVIKGINEAKEYKNALLDSAALYGQKSFQAFGAKFEIKEVGVKYDYSQCNDHVLDSLQADLEKATEAVKQRQKFLQSIRPEGHVLVDEETGEPFKVYPPSKSSTTSVATTLL